MPQAISVLFVFTLLAISPQLAHACSCAVPSREAAFAGATDVFEARVMSIRLIGTNHTGQLAVELDIAQRWKGSSRGRVTAYIDATSRMCPGAFHENVSYLVYASLVQGRLQVAVCGRSGAISAAQADVRAMGPPVQ